MATDNTNTDNKSGVNENGVQTSQETGNKDNQETGKENKVNYEELLKTVDIDELLKQGTIANKIQATADKRVTEALKNAKAKWDAEAASANDEAAKLAKMTEAEQEKYKFDKEKRDFEEEKAKYNHQLLTLETSKQLIADGMPDIADYITGKDAETTAENIKKVKEILGAWKQSQLTDQMRGKAPKDLTPQTTVNKEDLKKMTKSQINAAFEKGLIKLN